MSTPLRGVTVRDALDSATIPLRGAGIETAELDAQLLVADALGVGREALFLDPDHELDGPATRRLQAAVRRRAIDREPLAYILGRRGFRHIELAVDARVLVPRPETELLVEAALGLARGRRSSTSGRAAARSRSRSSTSARTSTSSRPTSIPTRSPSHATTRSGSASTCASWRAICSTRSTSRWTPW